MNLGHCLVFPIILATNEVGGVGIHNAGVIIGILSGLYNEDVERGIKVQQAVGYDRGRQAASDKDVVPEHIVNSFDARLLRHDAERINSAVVLVFEPAG